MRESGKIRRDFVHIWLARAARNPAGERRVRFSVVDPAAAQILAEDQLLGTSVIPMEDQKMILDYRLEPKHIGQAAAIHVMLPDGVDSSVQAVRTLCRPRDRWEFQTFANVEDAGAVITAALSRPSSARPRRPR